MKPTVTYIGLLILSLLSLLSCHSEKEKKTYVVGISQCALDNAWRKAMWLDMQVEASYYPEMELIVKDGKEDSQRQIRQIQDLIDQKVDLLIISPNETEPITSVAEAAYKAGIPTIIIDRKINTNKYSTFIGADNFEIGRAAGQYVNTWKRGETCILEIWGSEGSSSAQERHEGFRTALSDTTNITFMTLNGNWSFNQVQQQITALDPDSIQKIDLIFAHNDEMALGARSAIQNRLPEALKRIKFIGVDAMPGKGLGLEAIMHGELTASCQYPTGGALAIRIAHLLLGGFPVSKNYALSSALIDKQNAETLYVQSEQVVDYQHQIEQQQENLSSMLSKYKFLQNSVAIILLLMGLLILLALYVVHVNRKVRRTNRELKRTNIQVKQQKEELAEANLYIEKETASKLQFFTNITHEIKTPLTLILGPLGKLSKEAPEGSSLASDLRIIRKNAERLKRVVDQLLDFRKVESNKMNMRVCQLDMVAFTAEVKSCFDAMAAGKQIHFIFEHPDCDSVLIWVDRDKMEKILTNLLSNAFKFTLDGGDITIRLMEKENSIQLCVEDNGKGISPESIDSIFDQFFTGDQNCVTGTGIGLHLTREFVQMHHGTIRVKSRAFTKTVFTVEIPKGKSHFDESCSFDPTVTELSCGVANLNTEGVQASLRNVYDYTVLVVEDDPDIRLYLLEELKQNFHVFSAINGVQALDILMKEDVFLILSDVMMPEMNGFDLCRTVKSDMALSHIPVILLTALSDDNQRMFGLAEGADDYIQKPFNIEIVKLRVIKILEERDRLRSAYAIDSKSPVSSIKREKAISMDELFMNRFLKLIEDSYMDPEFSIEKGSEKLGLSRVHLYRKVKELAGVTPTDYLRNYRLKKAAALLRQKSANVNEVAYATGFASPSYFSKCFKMVYNITPTEYMETI